MEKDIEIKFENLRSTVEIILRKNLFLVQFGYTKLADENETTLPFQCFNAADTHSFAKYLDTHLLGKGIPEMTQSLTKQFKKSIFEIFQNCATHSHTHRGVFVCGQFYPVQQILNITISDAGIGIRTNVRNHLRTNISSIDSIEWALQEGNTTKTGSQPGGFGLKLLQEFIELNEGKVQIASRLGYYEFNAGKPSYKKLTSDFRGTAINFGINTNDTKSYALGSKVSVEDIF